MVRLRDPTVRSTPPWVRVVCATQERGLVYANKGRGQAGAGAWVHPVSNPASHPERSEGPLRTMHRKHGAVHARPRGRHAARGRTLAYDVWAGHHSFSTIRLSRLTIGEVCSRRICSRPRKILTDRSARFECACVKRGVGQAREGKHVAKKRGWFSLVHALRPHHPRWDNLMAQAHSAVALRPRQPLRVLRVAVPQTA